MLETKSIAALAFNETPRKRKRETNCAAATLKSEGAAAAAAAAPGVTGNASSCFTNAAFSSTPKKLIGRRRLVKENEQPNPFAAHPGLEIKSIADLAAVQQQQKEQQGQLSLNPFEVVRQPSKKTKRAHACFENPALNLELPERQFNPYEVVRATATPTKGFVNEALNLRGNDAPASLNPFEIHRRSDISNAAGNPTGVENPALVEEPLPTNLKIGLPFTPRLNCRIDFHGLSLAQLTPSKLLAEKLVFSPVPKQLEAPAKRSLGAISEESSSMDIGKELDRYQLELENSINEAKLRKNGLLLETEQTELELVSSVEQGSEERRYVCTTRRQTLTEILEANEEERETEQQSKEKQLELPQLAGEDVAYASEDSEEEQEPEAAAVADFKPPPRFVRSYRPGGAAAAIAGSKESLHSITSARSTKSLELDIQSNIRKSIRKPKQQAELLEQESEKQTQLEGDDVAYASESEPEEEEQAELNFKAPTRFVRSYRPAATPAVAAVNVAGSKESLHSIASSKSAKSEELHGAHGVRNMIRKSIRKLMPKPQAEHKQQSEQESDSSEKPHHNILTSIRHSLRRRPQKPQPQAPNCGPLDVSIVDSSERTMKLRSTIPQIEYMTIDQLTNEKKHTLRNSIRRSTRDVLRHVFHKSHDAYATAK
ncbi:uncharacterized protein LOC6585678 [Drosophila mojavensis]|uniref:Uncharacterized protein n=1 Tax=Drosophila mojavensis TaxID=7230 RepID=B4L702_DROMO|nr:uncharacterized protein LOC6585678 [Drosophila mojavensis]EDW06148.1 uncharacterized protein Dmoj_GI16456 [Drosophila mojavensis]